MRTPLAAGNWKMHLGPDQAGAFVALLQQGIAGLTGVETVLFPPFISLSVVHTALAGTALQMGAQNCADHTAGEFTGEVSVEMIAQLCRWVIVGHSERRRYYGETDALVNRKTRLALAAGLQPIVCVGEQLHDHEIGHTTRIITTQVRDGLADLPPEHVKHVVIAYEPVWAIGTGRTETRQDIEEAIAVIRQLVGQMYGAVIASELRVLYGGSVTERNIGEFMVSPQIDGALVGGASIVPAFVSIAQAIATTTSQ